MQKEAQCALAILRLMGFNCGFLRWAGRGPVVQFARGRGRDDSKSQEAVFFFVLQHLKMQPWATTAGWSPFHLSRREIHTTTSGDPEILGWSLPQTEPFSGLTQDLSRPGSSLTPSLPVPQTQLWGASSFTPFPQAASVSGSCRGSGRAGRDLSQGPQPIALTCERAPTGLRPD